MSCNDHDSSFDEYIEKNWPEGVKKTHQRKDIYKILLGCDMPVSAAEIFSMLNSEDNGEKYAISTVYRNLLAFEKSGILTKTVLSTEDNAVYELKKAGHKHYAVCLKCKKKFPICNCPIHEVAHNLEDCLPGFEITGHQLEIYGYCKDCRES